MDPKLRHALHSSHAATMADAPPEAAALHDKIRTLMAQTGQKEWVMFLVTEDKHHLTILPDGADGMRATALCIEFTDRLFKIALRYMASGGPE